jgi:heterodisulfide reductase subunit D
VTILDHYTREKQRFLKNCTLCGLCAEGCPILPYTDIGEISPQDIQKAVFDFMESGAPNQLAYTKAFACMECFKCTAGMCPENLNPMLVNELIKSQYISKGLANKAYSDARQPDSAHRVLASVQVSASEYNRITTSGAQQAARYVFFPGCNVYFQPEKILNAMDIMDAIGDDYAFLPGLDHCCGDGLLFLGEIDEGIKRAEELVAAIASFQPEAALLWCPTCQCRFDKSIGPAIDIPFKILSFPQYLAANMSRLPLTRAAAGTVTLHEACKSAYTGVDRDGPREVLRQLPGVRFSEMEHHGQETVCCGSGAVCWFPESFTQIRESRLQEAAQTGAGRLVTVCHYCSQAFVAEEAHYDFSVTNYVNLVAEAMGIQRDDKFKKYTLCGDLDLILKDAEDRIAGSPFGNERIIEVLRTVFLG